MSLSAFKPAKNLSWVNLQVEWKRLQQYIRAASKAVSIDLSEVESCDSSGLALLVAGKKWCQQHNKEYHIAGSPKNIAALASFYGVSVLLGL